MSELGTECLQIVIDGSHAIEGMDIHNVSRWSMMDLMTSDTEKINFAESLSSDKILYKFLGPNWKLLHKSRGLPPECNGQLVNSNPGYHHRTGHMKQEGNYDLWHRQSTEECQHIDQLHCLGSSLVECLEMPTQCVHLDLHPFPTKIKQTSDNVRA